MGMDCDNSQVTIVDTNNNPVSVVSGALKTDGSATTQPISAASLPLPSGASTAAGITTLDTDLSIINSNLTNGNALVKQSGTWTIQPGNTPNTTPWLTKDQQSSNLGVTGTAAAGTGVTVTLPAVAANFHYIALIHIQAYTTVARVGGATPVLVTSTNLPGSPVWDFQSAAAIGTKEEIMLPLQPVLKSSTINTATTIVCPATANIIWRVNVFYFTGV